MYEENFQLHSKGILCIKCTKGKTTLKRTVSQTDFPESINYRLNNNETLALKLEMQISQHQKISPIKRKFKIRERRSSSSTPTASASTCRR